MWQIVSCSDWIGRSHRTRYAQDGHNGPRGVDEMAKMCKLHCNLQALSHLESVNWVPAGYFAYR